MSARHGPTGVRIRRARRSGLALFAALAITGALASVASALPARTPDAKTLLPCFHREIHRYTAEVRPTACDIVGVRNDTRELVQVPVTGLRWSEWGYFRSRGSHGRTVALLGARRQGGTGVRLIAFHRTSCGDGFFSYSTVDVYFPGPGYAAEVEIPPCRGR